MMKRFVQILIMIALLLNSCSFLQTSLSPETVEKAAPTTGEDEEIKEAETIPVRKMKNGLRLPLMTKKILGRMVRLKR